MSCATSAWWSERWSIVSCGTSQYQDLIGIRSHQNLHQRKSPLHFPFDSLRAHYCQLSSLHFERSPPSYTTYPKEGRVVSPYSDFSSYSSHKSSPQSPGPKTPPDEDSRAPSTLGGKPVHIDFINRPLDIKMKHDNYSYITCTSALGGLACGVDW